MKVHAPLQAVEKVAGSEMESKGMYVKIVCSEREKLTSWRIYFL